MELALDRCLPLDFWLCPWDDFWEAAALFFFLGVILTCGEKKRIKLK
jgi:hypothetical protein